MKKIIAFFLSFALALAPLGVLAADAGSDTRVLINGTYLEMPTPPINTRGNLLVPLRALAEKLGGSVSWSQSARTASVKLSDISFDVTIGAATARVGGKDVALSTPARIVSGNTLVPIRFISNALGASISWDGTNSTAIIDYNPGKFDVVSYNLGSAAITPSSGAPFNFNMIGAICVPEGENRPIAVVIHGRHDVTDIDGARYDLGFSYLLQSLARAGYLAVSLNVNMQNAFVNGEPVEYERLEQIYSAHIAKLKAANDGSDIPFGVHLEGKGDFSNVSLIGHSIGGQGVFYIANDQIKRGNDIKSIVAIAPSLATEMDEAQFPSVPTAVILPQYDDDVISLDGQRAFDVLSKRADSYAQLVYLKGANHNSFNTALTSSASNDILSEHKIYPPISATVQRDFLMRYVTDFLSVANGKAPTQSGFGAAEKAPANMYGCDVLTQLKTPGEKIVFTPGDTINTKNAVAKKICSSKIFSENTAGALVLPGFNNVFLKSIAWTSVGATASFPLAADISGYSALAFNIAADSTSALNSAKNQALSVRITDKSGASHTVKFDNTTPALSHQDGVLIPNDVDGVDASYWSTFTPLSALRINLTEIHDIDLRNIAEFSLVFDTTTSGVILIGSVALQK